MANATQATLPPVAAPVAPQPTNPAPAPKAKGKGGPKKGQAAQTKPNNKIVLDLGSVSVKEAVMDQGGSAYIKDLISKDLFSRNLLVYSRPE